MELTLIKAFLTHYLLVVLVISGPFVLADMYLRWRNPNDYR